MSNKLNETSKGLYKAGRLTRWIRVLQRCIKEKSLKPLFKRLYNAFIGRKIVSKLWMR